jgi:hypothetical protein
MGREAAFSWIAGADPTGNAGTDARNSQQNALITVTARWPANRRRTVGDWDNPQSDRNRRLDRALFLSYTLQCWSGGRMCFPQLRVALVSVVCVIVFLSSCVTPYGTIGGASETQLAPDSYRVSFSPTGSISWELAYRSALLRCAELTIQRGYRYFGVVAVENYSAVNSFAIPTNSYAHGFYNANTAYNPPHSLSISYWPLPVLTIRMLRAPIPGVTLDAKAIRNRGITAQQSFTS